MSKPSKLMRNGKLKKKGIKAWKVRKPVEEKQQFERCRDCQGLRVKNSAYHCES